MPCEGIDDNIMLEASPLHIQAQERPLAGALIKASSAAVQKGTVEMSMWEGLDYFCICVHRSGDYKSHLVTQLTQKPRHAAPTLKGHAE